MRIKLSPDVVKDLKKIKQRDVTLAGRIEKQLTLFKQNQKHPSLRTHKLTGSLGNRWSISITRSIRMVYVVMEREAGEEKIAYFVAIGTHKQVYRS